MTTDRQGPPNDEGPTAKPRLVASADSVSARGGSASHAPRDQSTGYFESAQWTADGTTILTTSSRNVINGYILPEDLLSPRPSALSLDPSTTIPLPERTNVLAPAPYFSLAEPYTHQILISARDHPIQLFYLHPDSGEAAGPTRSAASYPFLRVRSETFETASSLLWCAPGTHFVAGCRNLLARFDASRPGSEPVLRIKTIPSDRHLSKGGGVGMRGIVSTMAAQPGPGPGPASGSAGSLLAAGTWTRCVGLYDFAQAGACVATWSISTAADDAAGVGGGGISQTAWSPCGRYLLISERRSTGVLVYDVRVTGKMLGWLAGRENLSNQRVSCDVFPGQTDPAGFEVWSGTSQGTVKVWEGVGCREASHEPAWHWQAHESTVGSTSLHQSGTVVATCSGSRNFPDDEKADTRKSVSADGPESPGSPSSKHRECAESSLKLWSIETAEELE